MAKTNSFNKRDLEKKKELKRQEKLKSKEERKANAGSKSFEDMIAYVDENGVITSTPPDPGNKQEINIEDIAVSTPKKEDVIIEEVVLKGQVEHFNKEKGFGFIKQTGSIEKYFFHISNAPASIAKGDMVTFELEHDQRGTSAVKITLDNKSDQ